MPSIRDSCGPAAISMTARQKAGTARLLDFRPGDQLQEHFPFAGLHSRRGWQRRNSRPSTIHQRFSFGSLRAEGNLQATGTPQRQIRPAPIRVDGASNIRRDDRGSSINCVTCIKWSRALNSNG
jgi:hypothetical protein